MIRNFKLNICDYIASKLLRGYMKITKKEDTGRIITKIIYNSVYAVFSIILGLFSLLPLIAIINMII